MKKKLNFSNKLFEAAYVKDVSSLKILNYGIVTNLDKNPLAIGDSSSIKLYKSYLLKDTVLKKVKKAVVVTFDFDPARANKAVNEFCQKHWHDNKVRYPHNPEKWHFKILMSPKDKVGKMEFNAWFLPKNTTSSIHHEHPFPKEVHTQLYGLGIMNKFKTPDPKTLYQREYMPPGYTHDIFYDQNFNYPWHQYEAITASIWLAIMEYK